MNYTLVVNPDRVQYLVKELGDNITIKEQEESSMIEVTIKIDCNLNILSVFHAGIECGLDCK